MDSESLHLTRKKSSDRIKEMGSLASSDAPGARGEVGSSDNTLEQEANKEQQS